MEILDRTIKHANGPAFNEETRRNREDQAQHLPTALENILCHLLRTLNLSFLPYVGSN